MAWKQRLALKHASPLRIIWCDTEDIKTPAEILQPFSVPEDNSREKLGCGYLLSWNASSMTRFEPLNHSGVTVLKKRNTTRDQKILKSSRPAASFHVCTSNLSKVNHHKNWHLAHLHIFFVIDNTRLKPSSYTPETGDFDSYLKKHTRTLATWVSVKSPQSCHRHTIIVASALSLCMAGIGVGMQHRYCGYKRPKSAATSDPPPPVVPHTHIPRGVKVVRQKRSGTTF